MRSLDRREFTKAFSHLHGDLILLYSIDNYSHLLHAIALLRLSERKQSEIEICKLASSPRRSVHRVNLRLFRNRTWWSGRRNAALWLKWLPSSRWSFPSAGYRSPCTLSLPTSSKKRHAFSTILKSLPTPSPTWIRPSIRSSMLFSIEVSERV